MTIAAWSPGDQIVVEVKVKGFNPDPWRYIVTDVDWSKPDLYRYEVWQVTKSGRFYERGGQTCVFPSDRIRITRCDEPLPQETQSKCASCRVHAKYFLEDVRDRGEIEHILKWVRERRAQRVY